MKPEPEKLNDWQIQFCADAIEEWRLKPEVGDNSAGSFAAKAGTMYAVAVMLLQHARAVQAERST